MFGSSAFLIAHSPTKLRGAKGGPEQRTDDLAELRWFGHRRVGCAAEHAAQLDRRPSLRRWSGTGSRCLDDGPRERATSVGRAIDTFVAVVVGQPVGEHDEQPTRRSRLLGVTAVPCRMAAQAASTQPGVRLRRRRIAEVSRLASNRLTGMRLTATDPVSETRTARLGRRARATQWSALLPPRAVVRARCARWFRPRPRSPRHRAAPARRDRVGYAGCRHRRLRRAPTPPASRRVPQPPRRHRCRHPGSVDVTGST